ncbi:MAG: hypothetical protein JWM36_3102 [Hyphomicrobiales bacterium]|nr:hypothetical protein [Hyphomicrobiales bacterium]
MNIDRLVMAFAGSMVFISVTCAVLFSPWWLAVAAFVGLNLFQSAFTGFCPLAIVLRRLGFEAGTAF